MMTHTRGSAAVLLAEDVLPRRPLADTMAAGSWQRRGRVVAPLPGGGWRRAEHGTVGPLVLHVRPAADRLLLQVHGHPATPPGDAAAALEATARWAGVRDDLRGFSEVAGGHPVVRRALQLLGAPVIGGLPRAVESFGRAVLGQLVQGLEAAGSEGQLLLRIGQPTGEALWAWPTARAIGTTPAHTMRRCGISLRGAGALHGYVRADGAVQRLAAEQRWAEVDTALTRIPGVGPWTSAETRLWLGDPDAVSVGDYHIPALVGWALGERTEDDESMLTLLAPFAGHRGRVIRLLARAARQRVVPAKPRRGPRQALSAHRYW